MAAEFHRSIGLELGGSKNSRTAIAVVDFFPTNGRLVLTEVDVCPAPLKGEDPDRLLVEQLQDFAAGAPSGGFSGIGVHGPTSFPRYADGEGDKARDFAADSRDPELKWMRSVWESLDPRPRPFAPYLQRPAEIWMRHLTREKFQIGDGLGSNAAPIAARLRFLLPHLPGPVNEVFPRASVERIARSLGLEMRPARTYTDLELGLSAREILLREWMRKLPQIFAYERDLEGLALNLNCFNAFVAAITQHLAWKGLCEKPPKGYPKGSAWIHIPSSGVDWAAAFKSA